MFFLLLYSNFLFLSTQYNEWWNEILLNCKEEKTCRKSVLYVEHAYHYTNLVSIVWKLNAININNKNRKKHVTASLWTPKLQEVSFKDQSKTVWPFIIRNIS